MKKELLVVYNLCGLKNLNTEMWFKNIDDLLKQEGDFFDVCISACNVNSVKNQIIERYKGKAKINFIYDIAPVNITFNKACQVFPDYKYYVYCASDVGMNGNTDTLKKLLDFHKSKNYGLSAAFVNEDCFHQSIKHYNRLSLKGQDIEFKIGESFNAHFFIFDYRIRDAYGRFMPDIFKTHCTESIFSYLCLGIGLKMGMLNGQALTLEHRPNNIKDGASSGFQTGKVGPNDMFTGEHVDGRLCTPEAKEVGFGYEEVGKYFMHDPNCYDENGYSKNPTKLLGFVKKAVYLQPTEYNYERLSHETIV